MTARLAEALKQLPPDAVEEVTDFAEFLSKKQADKASGEQSSGQRIGLSWAGALSDLKDQYKSGVELQHAILEEWANMTTEFQKQVASEGRKS